MKFCPGCHNMLYIKVSKPGDPSAEAEDGFKLVYACKNCGYQRMEDNTNLSSSILENTSLRTAAGGRNGLASFTRQAYHYIQNDPSLPRVNNIKCPEEECPSNKNGSVDPEVIFMKVDPVNLKYVYFCTRCDAIWQNRDKL